MFVYSVRASTIKFFGVICVALAALVTLIAFVPTYVGGAEPTGGESVTTKEISYDKVKTAADAQSFLSQFGWQVDEGATKSTVLTIPGEFDKVLSGYNEIQKRQGLDLTKYKNREVTRYTFTVTNYSGYDPEVDSRRSTPLTPGVDYSAYPKSRGVVFGLNLTF